MKLTFTGKTGLIIGGGGEISLALAYKMAETGLFPILTYRSPKSLERINAVLEGVPTGFMAFPLNLSNRESIETMLFEIEKNGLEGPDYAADLAQGDFERLIASADDGDTHKYFEENITSKAALIKALARRMLPRKFGRLVYVSSAAAVRLNPGQGLYAASKQAVETLYRALGVELGGHGITTASLRLGYVDAGRGRRFLSSAPEVLIRKTPLGRALTTEEAAGMILFLLSDQALGVNATEVVMDGGLCAGK